VPGIVGNSSPTRMAMAPSGRFLFVNDSTGFAISVFAVNATTGALTAVAGSPYALQDPRAIAVDPTGQFLYVATANARIAGFTVDGTTGALTAIGAGSFVTDSTAHALNVDPSGKFLYAVSGGMTTVHAIDPVTGMLTQQPNGTHVTRRASAIEFLEGAGPSTLKAKFAYVGNGQASTISGYTLDNASGSLMPIAGSPFAAGSGTWGMTLTPNGKFLYAANSGAVHASGFTVDAATGALTQIAGSPFDAGRSPYSLVTDPSGRFVYSGGWKSEALVGLRIDQSTGVLASIGIGPTLFPYFVAMHPSGRFVYVGSPQESTITMFEIDVTTGTVTQAGTPFAMSPVQHMAMSPSGRFLYASVVGLTPGIVSLSIGPTGQLSSASSYNTGQRNVAATAVHPNERFFYAAVASSDTVLGFNIAPDTGVLSEFAGNSFATGDDPSMVSIDPSGKFLYVSNFGSANVSAFTINPSTGALTALSNSPFAAANGAGPMVFSATLE
jgi:6-phosphogluconolactonase